MGVFRSILRFGLAATFLLSGSAKLVSLPTFAAVIHTFVTFPTLLLYCIAAILCIVELFLGVMLLFTRWIAIACFGVMLMTLAFTGVQVMAIADGRTGDCFCFGEIVHETIGWETLARNCLILIGSWTLIQIHSKDKSI